jgi:pimeloyl-ACP methyl ester carboxylesterase
VKNAEVEIHYEEFGAGYPILLIAPGGMSSAIEFWERATINPIATLKDDFRLIAMDQRNASGSTGPFPSSRPWDAYRNDQLLVADALGLETFHLFGCCIGGPFALRLAHDAPQRVRGVVLEQPLGIVPDNRESWMTRCHAWAKELASMRTDLAADDGARFVDEMWQNDFVASLTRKEVKEIEVPMCVLPGIDEFHPTVIEPWKDTPDHTAQATEDVRDFLWHHTPHEL